MSQSKSDGVATPIPTALTTTAAVSTPYAWSAQASFGPNAAPQIRGAGPEAWFGPLQPLPPLAPPGTAGRAYDYPFGYNLNYIPRAEAPITFEQMRALRDNLPLLATIVENRKDRIASWSWAIRPKLRTLRKIIYPTDQQLRKMDQLEDAIAVPDRRNDFHTWLRPIIDDMLVIDAPCIYPRFTNGGDLYSLEYVDGATIRPLIGADGRAPLDPDPAYQQILHGVPAADFTLDELMYVPRNKRTHGVYGFSPVEQIIMTVNIALRRDVSTLEYYRKGTIPDSFGTLPKEWTTDQISQFQDYFDSMMAGNLAKRRSVFFMPETFKAQEIKPPPLKDAYDEWLTRIICFAFQVPPSAFISSVNRATADTLHLQAENDGSVPTKAWIKSWMDKIIQIYLKAPDYEFAWVGDDAVDPLQQAQTLQILVGSGIKTRDEARSDLGLPPAPPDPNQLAQLPAGAPSNQGSKPAADTGQSPTRQKNPRAAVE